MPAIHARSNPNPSARIAPEAERSDAERRLDAEGIPLRLDATAAAASLAPHGSNRLLVVESPEGRPVAATGIVRRPAKGAPFLSVLRAPAVRPVLDASAARVLARGFVVALRSDPRAVRIEVRLYAQTPAARTVTASALADEGFQRAAVANDYRHTLFVDLSGSRDDVFARLDRSARRNVREIAKHPLRLAPIDDERWESRLDELHWETVHRTGGRTPPPNWREAISLSRGLPLRSRFVGIFSAAEDEPTTLLAYAWGKNHGDVVEYSHGGSTRATATRVALAYPLIWDLIAWGHDTGARWFDLGGVTMGTADSGDDPLGGISDFKRFFSRNLVEVAEEWVLESDRLVARLATGARRVLGR